MGDNEYYMFNRQQQKKAFSENYILQAGIRKLKYGMSSSEI